MLPGRRKALTWKIFVALNMPQGIWTSSRLSKQIPLKCFDQLFWSHRGSSFLNANFASHPGESINYLSYCLNLVLLFGSNSNIDGDLSMQLFVKGLCTQGNADLHSCCDTLRLHLTFHPFRVPQFGFNMWITFQQTKSLVIFLMNICWCLLLAGLLPYALIKAELAS